MRQTPSRLTAEMLRLLADAATPAPWDIFGSWVSAVASPPDPTASMGKGDPDTHRFYGGELICESVSRADARLIAATRNLLPTLVDAHLAALDQIAELENQLHYAKLSEKEANAMTDLVRSQRYAPSEYPIMRVRRNGAPAWSGVGCWSGGRDL